MACPGKMNENLHQRVIGEVGRRRREIAEGGGGGRGNESRIAPPECTETPTVRGMGNESRIPPPECTETPTVRGMGNESGIAPPECTETPTVRGMGNESRIPPPECTKTPTVRGMGNESGIVPPECTETPTVRGMGNESRIPPPECTEIPTVGGMGESTGNVVTGVEAVGTMSGDEMGVVTKDHAESEILIGGGETRGNGTKMVGWDAEIVTVVPGGTEGTGGEGEERIMIVGDGDRGMETQGGVGDQGSLTRTAVVGEGGEEERMSQVVGGLGEAGLIVERGKEVGETVNETGVSLLNH